MTGVVIYLARDTWTKDLTEFISFIGRVNTRAYLIARFELAFFRGSVLFGTTTVWQYFCNPHCCPPRAHKRLQQHCVLFRRLSRALLYLATNSRWISLFIAFQFSNGLWGDAMRVHTSIWTKTKEITRCVMCQVSRDTFHSRTFPFLKSPYLLKSKDWVERAITRVIMTNLEASSIHRRFALWTIRIITWLNYYLGEHEPPFFHQLRI